MTTAVGFCSEFLDGLGLCLESERRDAVGTLDPRFILDSLHRYGVILLRNFNADQKQCRDFIEGIGVVTAELEIAGTHFLGYHGELTYTPFPPDLLAFFCAEAADDGGETRICDGVAVFEQMPPRLRRFFESTPICLTSRWSAEYLRRRFPVPDLDMLEQVLGALPGVTFLRRDDAPWEISLTTLALRKTRFTGAVAFVNSIITAIDGARRGTHSIRYSATLADGKPFPEEVLREIIDLTNRHTRLIPWKNADLAVLDNSRVMHGRMAAGSGTRRMYSLSCTLRQPTPVPAQP
jgi:alpha-ketoglutarate-dependent taurine dioxygenase